MKNLKWKTEKRKVKDLKLHKKNPRKISPEKLMWLIDRIQRLGFSEVPCIDIDNTINAGNKRIKALREMNHPDYKEIDVRVPNRKLTKAEFDEHCLGSNIPAGEWDEDMLSEEFDEEFLQFVGFDESFIEELFDGETTEGNIDDDDVPEVDEKEVYVKTGDLYQLGNHRLLCGDATKKEDVDRLMDGAKADMVFTDPPYGVDYSGGIQFTKEGVKKEQREKLNGDNVGTEIYKRVVPIISNSCNGAIYLWFSDTQALSVYQAVNTKGDIHALIIWVKSGGYAAMNSNYKQRHEPCLYWKPKGRRLSFIGKTTESTVWEIKKDGVNKFHPTQKPVELAERAIRNHKCKTVLDLFGGSGSTLIACEKTNRKCFMMEIDPYYCQVIIERWEQFTGEKAVKL